MATDPDEQMYEDAIERKNPMRTPDALERIENRLHYGEFGGLTSIKIALWIIVGLLAILVFR